MQQMSKEKEKRCKTCKRIIVGESKTGICPECVRKGKGMIFMMLTSLTAGIFIGNKKK